MLERPLAFLRRDVTIAASYRLAFVMQFVGIFIGVASFYFVSTLMGPSSTLYLEEYGGSYFGYVLVGIALLGFQGVSMGSFSGAISGAQSQGTLEAMLVTPTSLATILMSSAIWDFFMASLNVFVYLLVGAVVFGADIGQMNILSALTVLVLTVFVFSGIGILSASAIMVLKRGDPVAWVFGSVSAFLGGTLFPVTVLPEWLQVIAHLLPVYYALDAMRLAVLQGATLWEIRGDVLVLTGFALFLVPVSIWTFRRAVRVAKTDGTLGTY